MQSAAIPLTLLTGFLGSGKTTLLNRLLPQPALGRCAVVINELGAIGLDHLFVSTSRDETIALLENGCLCCGVRDELAATVTDLLQRRMRGEIPAFERILIETTGLARPGPVISLLLGDPALEGRLQLDGIVTTVDAKHGAAQLARHEESRQQVAVADRLLLTKAELVDAPALADLEAALEALNPGAPRIPVHNGEIDAQQLLDILTPRALRPWLRVESSPAPRKSLMRGATASRVAHPDIDSFCLTYSQALPMQAFETALTVLLGYHGERILRVKGIGNFIGESRPVVFHGVQQLLHEPLRLEAWPDDDHTTRLVFIVQGLARSVIEETITHFLREAGVEAAASC
ncbi:CobW family GTP-binding protein [Paraburkholderia nemoris]|jgi:G3E family GTPase|uniref:P-loop guanosine triphosphatase YjiA n=1 Tax=Paraburkholderia nemoris TaxID=2793076 RepID=A0ABN7M1Q5_9BURK|nr:MULTISPECIES: GTP-binding protein [Paraburkholderia]MBK5147703.1 GTP-binding protein [Burkholderia sp. R-69608]MBK3739476.1 GTP-binding protein [Paraburkholderia aspalathi]MBK3782606.1 GTP-binding protein [Paraburkholderia aspalathi]MBK3812348.1 GTP-binding protein [Paraburkholderia aspalathi]CAE6700046.1 P-loop guanosine triphosphatase YjiA [Paraburkholderia nemoris]